MWPHESARGEASAHQSYSSSGWLHTLSFWIDRSRQRSQLGELAELNDDLLRDIGVTREEALREAAKPFWR
jgi:uncharacterized protein YjiS (DUF1127 family)